MHLLRSKSFTSEHRLLSFAEQPSEPMKSKEPQKDEMKYEIADVEKKEQAHERFMEFHKALSKGLDTLGASVAFGGDVDLAPALNGAVMDQLKVPDNERDQYDVGVIKGSENHGIFVLMQRKGGAIIGILDGIKKEGGENEGYMYGSRVKRDVAPGADPKKMFQECIQAVAAAAKGGDYFLGGFVTSGEDPFVQFLCKQLAIPAKEQKDYIASEATFSEPNRGGKGVMTLARNGRTIAVVEFNEKNQTMEIRRTESVR